MGLFARTNSTHPRRGRTNWRSAAIAAALACLCGGPALAQPDVPSPVSDSQPAAAAPPAPVSAHPDSRPLGQPRESKPGPAGRGADAGAGAAGSLGFLRTGLSLAFVVSLIVLGAVVARRVSKSKGGLAGAIGAGGPSPAGVLEVLGRYPVARGQSLVLLRAHDRVLLLSQNSFGRLGRTAGGGMNTLCEFTNHEEVAGILTAVRDADGDSLAARFRAMLSGHAAGDAQTEPMDGEPEVETGRRLAAHSPHGDRAELWDDHARGLHLAGEPSATALPPRTPPTDAATTLQRRLDAFRLGAAGGARA